MKGLIILLNYILIFGYACDFKHQPKDIHEDITKPITIDCNYDSLIRGELDRIYHDYEITKIKVSSFSEQAISSTSTWFIVYTEIQVVDPATKYEYAFLFNRQCIIELSINLNDSSNTEGFHIRMNQ